MKKFLLAIAAVMGIGLGASAQTTVTASQLQQAIGKAVVIDGYTFDLEKNNGSTAPAFNSSTSAIRLYAKGSIKIAGTKLTKIEFTLATDAYFRYTEFTPSVGAVQTQNPAVDKDNHDTSIVWEGDATEVTFTVGDKATLGTDGADKAGQIRFESVTIYGEGGQQGGGDDPIEPTGSKFTKATSLETGKYVFVVDNKIGLPIAANYSYGRLNLNVDANVEGNDLYTDEANALNLTVENGKVTIEDATRYYGMDETHLTTFQCFDAINSGCYFSYEFVDGALKLTNDLTGCIVCKSGTYANVAPAQAPDDYTLPVVYKLAQSGIEAVAAEAADAPVVYYNLQGQRVAAPEAGLYIRVQGNKADKVVIR